MTLFKQKSSGFLYKTNYLKLAAIIGIGCEYKTRKLE